MFTLLHLPVLQPMGKKNNKKEAVVRRKKRTKLEFADPFHPLGRSLKWVCLPFALALSQHSSAETGSVLICLHPICRMSMHLRTMHPYKTSVFCLPEAAALLLEPVFLFCSQC